jgi:hypothetical protein
MVIDQVIAAEQVVDQAVQEMQAVAARLGAQSAASQIAMKAPAGGITAQNYSDHSASGRVLAETLEKLRSDLVRTRQVLMAGSDQATAVASRVETGSSIASQM